MADKETRQDQYDIEKVQKNVRKGIVYWQIQDNLKDPQGLSSIHRQKTRGCHKAVPGLNMTVRTVQSETLRL